MASAKPGPDRTNGRVDGQENNADSGKEKTRQTSSSSQHSDKPAGGYDAAKVPHAPPGYTVKITFHRATHLPIADLSNLSSDPYVSAQIDTALPSRHKEDPILRWRSRTVWKTTEPEWDEPWILAHCPASGFQLKVRLYDEDSSDQDDRLGNVHIRTGNIDENWKDIKNQAYKIKKKTGSKRAYALRAMAVCMGRTHEMSGSLYVSIEVLGRSEGNEGGRMYTVGPCYWQRHQSPLLGRLTKSREPDDDASEDEVNNDENEFEPTDSAPRSKLDPTRLGKPHNEGGKNKSNTYTFQANQFQLRGPVPPELYHRYVDFRPIITSLFTSKGLRGVILHKALHLQHNKVYNFNRQTKYGVFQKPCDEMTRHFLDLVHHDKGGRIFTYMISLDALMRFTETGKEFGIDFLSKHTLHSDASIYIAYSGEFFIRRLKHPNRPSPEEAELKASRDRRDGDQREGMTTSQAEAETGNETHPSHDLEGGAPKGPSPHDPQHYELIIDNDSGTYRPNAALLPLLHDFLSGNFPGLRIVTLDCSKDKELMDRLKGEQREMKRKEGKGLVFTQVRGSGSGSGSGRGSLSSEDEERMEERVNGGERSGAPVHKLGEAAGPFLGNHPTLRKVVGAAT